MKKTAKTTVQSIVVLLLIAILSGLLLAICNYIFYVEPADGITLLKEVENANWSKQNSDIIDYTIGVVNTVATAQSKIGFVVVGEPYLKAKEFSVAVIIDANTDTVEKVVILQSGASAPTYDIKNSSLEIVIGMRIRSATTFDNISPKNLQSGATQSATVVLNALKCVARYYAENVL